MRKPTFILFLILSLSVWATNITSIPDLYAIGNNAGTLAGNYTLTADIDLDYIDGMIGGVAVPTWEFNTQYHAGDICKSLNGVYFVYCSSSSLLSYTEWITSHHYYVGNIVYESDTEGYYVCTVEHSSTTFEYDYESNECWTYFSVEALTDWAVIGSVGQGWRPIGNATTAFTGTFDGQNHVISNLFINRPTTDYVGLFGFAGDVNGTLCIKNMKLSSPVVTGYYQVGSLAGVINYIPAVNGIYNCHATNVTVVGRQIVGGLIGNLSTTDRNNIYVKNCSVVGGNVSSNTNSANRVVGGFSGTGNSKIEECFTTGVTITLLSSASEAGGFSGRCNWGIHTNCYARNTLAGSTTTVGSYFGGSLSSAGVCVFTNCYAVSGTDKFLGGVTDTAPTLTNCYYQGTGTDNGATGKTEVQMKTQGTFLGYNWYGVWGISGSYSFLRWQFPSLDTTNIFGNNNVNLLGNKAGVFGASTEISGN